MNIVKSNLRNRVETESVSSILKIRAVLSRVNKFCKNYALASEVLNTLAAYRNEIREVTDQTTSTSQSNFIPDLGIKRPSILSE